MNKYITDMIRNNTNALCKKTDCTAPQRTAIQQIVNGLFVKGTPVLRQLGDRKTSSAKKESERFGKHLEQVDIEDAVNANVLKKGISVLGENDVIAYDLSDIAKNCSKGIRKKTGKGMEWVGGCFDGSKREKAYGVALHGVGIGELLLRLKTHNSAKEYLPQIREEIIEDMTKTIGNKGIWAFDRGNDSKILFRFLQSKKLKFIVRLQKNRDIALKDTGEVMKPEQMKNGRYEVYIRDDHGKIDTKNTYLLVIRRHCKKYTTPIRLLCSTNLKEFGDKTLVKKYLHRWGVENSFKRIKSLYLLESIRVMKTKRLITLISLIQFVSLLSSKLYEKTEKSLCFLSSEMNTMYRKYLKKESLTYNLHSFGTFLRTVIPLRYRPKTLGGKKARDALQLTFWEFLDRKLGMS